MMKLSLMEQVVDTVTADWDCPVAEEILQWWEYDKTGIVKFARASANFVVVCERQGERHYLRFNSIEERSADFVAAEMELLNLLLAQRVPVVRPVPSLQGNYCETVATSMGSFTAVLFEALRGEPMEFKEMIDEHLESWGAALGRLHQVLKLPAFPRISRPAWEDLLDFAGDYIGDDELHLEQELQSVKQQLMELPCTQENYGIIHFDFEQDNLLWTDDSIQALDFDDAIQCWYAADICYALRDLFQERQIDFDDPKFRRFVQGYRSETSLDDAMLEHLSLFMRLHRLYFIARLRRALDVSPTDDLPDWLLGIHHKLSGLIARYIEDIEAGVVICR